MELGDDEEFKSRARAILHVLLKVGANPTPRTRIAKELEMDPMSGRLEHDLVRMHARGWIQPHGRRLDAANWTLTDEGRSKAEP